MPSYVRGRPTQRLLSDEEILRLYVEEELDGDTIAYRAGCNGTTILAIVRKLGGVVRERGGRNERKTLKLTDAEIIQRYNDGARGDVPVDVANGWALPRLTTTRPRRGWQGWNGRQGSLRAPLSGPAGRL